MAKNTRNNQTDEDVYENAIKHEEDPKRQKSAERKPASSKTTVKFLLVFLGLLLIGALIALCVLGFCYHNQSASFDEFSERFANATAEPKLQELKTTDEKKCDSDKVINWKFQQVHQCLSVQNATKTCELCDEGWRSLGLKCYFFSTNNLNWMASQDYCIEKGGHLVIITSQAEQNFLASHFRVLHWIGLNDLETEGKWMWVNNKTLDETGVKFWYTRTDQPSEPDNWREEDPSGENCACMGHLFGAVGDWFDITCRRKQKYICEKQV